MALDFNLNLDGDKPAGKPPKSPYPHLDADLQLHKMQQAQRRLVMRLMEIVEDVEREGIDTAILDATRALPADKAMVAHIMCAHRLANAAEGRLGATDWKPVDGSTKEVATLANYSTILIGDMLKEEDE